MASSGALAGFCLNGPGTHNQDTDRDGFVDCEDNCPLQPNDQTDSDDNGIGDECDCGIAVPPGDGSALRVAILTAPPDCAMARRNLLFNVRSYLRGRGERAGRGRRFDNH